MSENYYKKVTKIEITAGDSVTITDGLHDLPFKNLTIWARCGDPSISFNYSIDYGGAVQSSGSKSAGAILSFTDPQILPPNNPKSNWSEQSPDSPEMYAVGVPINVTITNTGGSRGAFLVSIISETYSSVI